MWIYIFSKYFPLKEFRLSFVKRTFHIRQRSTGNARELLFPWTQILKDDHKPSPFLYKIMGFLIMKKILQNVNAPFKNQEFMEGVQAISVVTSAISLKDTKNLEGMMGMQLAQCFRNAFLTLSEKQQTLCLELQKTRLLNITGVKSTFGKADPSDKQVLRVCGQEIVLSKRKMQSVVEESETPWNDSKAVGETAAKLGVTFQVDVKFKSQERFYVENDSGVIIGSRDVKTCYHVWQFETYVDWVTWERDTSESYPLSWKVSDMDKFIGGNFPTKDSFDTIV